MKEKMNEERRFLQELSRTIIDMDNYPDFDFTSDIYQAVRLFRQIGIEVSCYRRDITGKNKIVFGRKTERTGRYTERVLDEGVEIQPEIFLKIDNNPFIQGLKQKRARGEKVRESEKHLERIILSLDDKQREKLIRATKSMQIIDGSDLYRVEQMTEIIPTNTNHDSSLVNDMVIQLFSKIINSRYLDALEVLKKSGEFDIDSIISSVSKDNQGQALEDDGIFIKLLRERITSSLLLEHGMDEIAEVTNGVTLEEIHETTVETRVGVKSSSKEIGYSEPSHNDEY